MNDSKTGTPIWSSTRYAYQRPSSSLSHTILYWRDWPSCTSSFFWACSPWKNTLVATFTPRRLHHSAFGMKFILTFGVGALAVKMVEYIDAAWGVAATYSALGFISIILVADILLLIYWTSRPVHEPSAEAAVNGQGAA